MTRQAQMQIIEAPTLEQMVAIPNESEVILAMPMMQPGIPIPVGINFECVEWGDENREIARQNFAKWEEHNREHHPDGYGHPLLIFVIVLCPQIDVPDTIPESWTHPEKGR